MRILAIECSGKTASCCFWEGCPRVTLYADLGMTHSQTLLPLCLDALRIAGVRTEDIDNFAVSAGPGSFTGLRIGIAAAKGMAMPTGAACTAVSTLEGLAYNFAGSYMPVLTALDARRGQVYAALFDCSDGKPKRLRPDCAAGTEELADWATPADIPPLVVGSGAPMVGKLFSDRGIPFKTQGVSQTHDAAGIAAAAADGRGIRGSFRDILPVYLRRPQAERERDAKNNP